MRKLFAILVYMLTFAAPAMIVEYYDLFIDPMSPSDKRMAIITGTIAVLVMAILTGFGGIRKPNVSKTPKVPKMPTTRIIRDPATGAETLYHWNDSDKTWESDYGTVLDESRLKDWERQRKSDRQWSDQQMQKLVNRDTALDRELDQMRQHEKEELEKMERDNQARDLFAKKHGIYETTEEERRSWLSENQNKEALNAAEWTEYGNEYDRVVNYLEWVQWSADLGVEAVDIISLGTLKPVKYLYYTSRNMAGSMMDSVVNKKGLATGAAKGVVKSVIDIKQDTTSKIGYKYLMNGFGDGIKGAMDAESGKRTEAFVKEGLKGTLRTGIEHGLSNVKLPKTGAANKIIKETAQKSNKVLGMQQAGQLSQKTANGIRNIIRTNGAQKVAAEAAKTKDLLNLGLGKLSDGTVNMFYGQ